MGGKGRAGRGKREAGRKRRRKGAPALPSAPQDRSSSDDPPELEFFDSDTDGGPAALHIGGIRVVCDDRRKLRGRRPDRAPDGPASEESTGIRQKQRSASPEGSRDDSLKDYAENILRGAETEDFDSEVHDTEAEEDRYTRTLVGMFATLGNDSDDAVPDPAEGRPPEEIGPQSSDQEGSGMEDAGGDADAGSLGALYPIQIRPLRRPSDDDGMMDHLEFHERRRRCLLPGEKKRLRTEKIMAKRAARAACKGFSLSLVRDELQNLVVNNGDVHAFPPMGKMEMHLVQRLAGLYGLRSSVQGTGKKRFVLVRSSNSMALPSGVVLAELQDLMQKHAKLEKFGANVKAAAARNDPNSMLPAVGAGPSARALSRRAVKPLAGRVYSQPVDFVRSHVQNTDSPFEVELPAYSPPLKLSALHAAPVPGSLETGYLQEESEEHELSSGSPLATAGLGYSEPDKEGTSLAAEAATTRRGAPGGHPFPQSRAGEDAAGTDTPDASDSLARQLGENEEGGREDCDVMEAEVSISDQQTEMSSGAWQPVGLAATKAGQKKAKKKAEKDWRRAARQQQQQDEVSAPGPAQREGPDGGPALQYGAFERYTTGFGSRMLARMGFGGEGAGLGREGQGIAEPLQARMRPRQAGLGHEGRMERW